MCKIKTPRSQCRKFTSSRLQSWTPYVTIWKVFFSQVIQLHMHAFIYSAQPVQTKRSIHENNFTTPHIRTSKWWAVAEEEIVNILELFSFADFSTVFHKLLPCFLHIQFMALLMKRSHRAVWYVEPYKCVGVCAWVWGCVQGRWSYNWTSALCNY